MSIRTFLFTLAGFFVGGCQAQPENPTQVGQVDLERYVGRWYEIASFPASFQKGCQCTTAEYSLTGKNYIRVINRCRRNSPHGKESVAKGKAFIVPGSKNTKLKVQFFWPFRGDYHIVMLDNEYQWAVVASGDKFLWILSRTPTMNRAVFDNITSRLSDMGYDISRLQTTQQGCGA